MRTLSRWVRTLSWEELSNGRVSPLFCTRPTVIRHSSCGVHYVCPPLLNPHLRVSCGSLFHSVYSGGGSSRNPPSSRTSPLPLPSPSLFPSFVFWTKEVFRSFFLTGFQKRICKGIYSSLDRCRLNLLKDSVTLMKDLSDPNYSFSRPNRVEGPGYLTMMTHLTLVRGKRFPVEYASRTRFSSGRLPYSKSLFETLLCMSYLQIVRVFRGSNKDI